MRTQEFTITHEGRPVDTVTSEDAAFGRLLRLQGQSTDYALKWGGWAIVPADEAPRPERETHHEVGRTVDGGRMVVSIKVEPINPDGEPDTTRRTIDHEPVSGPAYRVSIMGGVLNRPATDYTTCGQNREDLGRLKALAPGWTTGDVASLAAIWERWHLNDMRPGCAHMPDSDQLEREPDKYNPRGRISCSANVCAAGSGYTWGKAWLYEAPPAAVLHELDRLQSLPAGNLPGWLS